MNYDALAKLIVEAQSTNDWTFVREFLMDITQDTFGAPTSNSCVPDDRIHALADAITSGGTPCKLASEMLLSLYLEWEQLNPEQHAIIAGAIYRLLTSHATSTAKLNDDQFNVLYSSVDLLGRKVAGRSTFDALANIAKSDKYEFRILACVGLKYYAVSTSDQSQRRAAVSILQRMSKDAISEVADDASIALRYIDRKGVASV